MLLGQMKANRAGKIITADNVSGFIHVLSTDRAATPGVFTTTASFAPRIRADPRVAPYLGARPQLMDGPALRTALIACWRPSGTTA